MIYIYIYIVGVHTKTSPPPVLSAKQLEHNKISAQPAAHIMLLTYHAARISCSSHMQLTYHAAQGVSSHNSMWQILLLSAAAGQKC